MVDKGSGSYELKLKPFATSFPGELPPCLVKVLSGTGGYHTAVVEDKDNANIPLAPCTASLPTLALIIERWGIDYGIIELSAIAEGWLATP